MFGNLVNRVVVGLAKVVFFVDSITFNHLKLSSKLINRLSEDLKHTVLFKSNWFRQFAYQPNILSAFDEKEKFKILNLKKDRDGDTLFHYLARNGHHDSLKDLYHSFSDPSSDESIITCYKLVIPYLSNLNHETVKDLLPSEEKKFYKSEKEKLQNFRLSISDVRFLRRILVQMKINKGFNLFEIDYHELFRDLKEKAAGAGLKQKPILFIDFGSHINNGYCINNTVILSLGKIRYLAKWSGGCVQTSLGRSLFDNNPYQFIRTALQSTIGHEMGHMYFKEQQTSGVIKKCLNKVHADFYQYYSVNSVPYDLLLGACLALCSSHNFLDNNYEMNLFDILKPVSIYGLVIFTRISSQLMYCKASRYEEQQADKFSRNLSNDCLKGQYAYFKLQSEKYADRKSLFSTHPSHSERAEVACQALIKKGYQLT